KSVLISLPIQVFRLWRREETFTSVPSMSTIRASGLPILPSVSVLSEICYHFSQLLEVEQLSKFDFWNSDETQIEQAESEEPSTEVEKIPPMFPESAQIPDTITKTWVEAQLPKSVWNRHRGKCTPSMIAEMAKVAAKTPSKRGLM